MVAFLAPFVLAACGPSEEDNVHVQTLPNSLADATAHEAEREIPSYGPRAPELPDSSRSAKARGQVRYAPVYSRIFNRSADREIALTATLGIRNTSPAAPLHIREVDHFGSEGTLPESYLQGEPRRLGPLASTCVVISEGDRSGGGGANFIVEWEASRPVSPPLVETAMISTAATQGISLTSSARVVEEG